MPRFYVSLKNVPATCIYTGRSNNCGGAVKWKKERIFPYNALFSINLGLQNVLEFYSNCSDPNFQASECSSINMVIHTYELIVIGYYKKHENSFVFLLVYICITYLEFKLIADIQGN